MSRQNINRILSELPDGVQLVAAAKARTPAEVLTIISAGVKIIGENYVQEAEKAYEAIGSRAKWHFIGHLQRNKVKKAVRLFDMIETVDSIKIARQIDKWCAQIDKMMPILVEVNSGCEKQKSGILPEMAEELIRYISAFKNIRVMGLMTMGPHFGNPENTRPYFAKTKKIFEHIKGLNLSNVQMKYLSMGMSNSYQVALEEGANIVRIGSKLFGKREYGATTTATTPIR